MHSQQCLCVMSIMVYTLTLQNKAKDKKLFRWVCCLGGQAELPGLELWICLSDCKDELQLLKTVNNIAQQSHILHTTKTEVWLGFHLTVWSIETHVSCTESLWVHLTFYLVCAVWVLDIKKLIYSASIHLFLKESSFQKPEEMQVFLF